MVYEDAETRELVRRAINSATPRPAPGFVLRTMSAIREPRSEQRSPRFSRGRHRTLLLSLTAVGLLMVLAVSPLAQAATSPVANRLLAVAGLGPNDASRLTPAGGSLARATSSGHTVTLLGAYGDQLHVVLFLRHENDQNVVYGPAELTDDSGKHLGEGRQMGGTPDGVALEYGGLPPGTYQLTLRIPSLLISPPFRFMPPTGVKGDWTFVKGDWTLRFPLTSQPAQMNAIPAGGDVGRVHVQVVGTGGGENAMFLQLQMTGATLGELVKMHETGDEAHPATPGPGAFSVQVFDARGRAVTERQRTLFDTPSPGTGGQGRSQKGKGQSIYESQVRDVTYRSYLLSNGPGTYRLVVTYEGHQFESRFELR